MESFKRTLCLGGSMNGEFTHHIEPYFKKFKPTDFTLDTFGHAKEELYKLQQQCYGSICVTVYVYDDDCLITLNDIEKILENERRGK